MPAEKSKYLMATGLDDFAHGGRGSSIQPSRSVVYVAEVTTGTAIAYYLPYNVTARDRGPYRRAASRLPSFPDRTPVSETKPKRGSRARKGSRRPRRRNGVS